VETDADLALVERCLRGDREAFTDLVVRYQRPIYNAAYWILRRPEDASDVAQTVFLKVAERLDDYDPNHRFFSWIYRIAVNEALNVLRRNGHEEPLAEDADFEDGRKNPEDRASDGERAVQVRRALMKLPANDRAVLVLRHFSELSYQEIADALDVDEKTVKSRLFEARQRMRALLPTLADR
jgi:RNA polymerase sigma-70 factor (ECF subfamily)